MSALDVNRGVETKENKFRVVYFEAVALKDVVDSKTQ